MSASPFSQNPFYFGNYLVFATQIFVLFLSILDTSSKTERMADGPKIVTHLKLRKVRFDFSL